MTTVARRIVAGLGANAFGQVVHVVIQLLSIPLFLRRWDVATYGIWLMLSATPAYLAMADVGMVTVAGNRMTMAMGRGDAATANMIFQSALALTAGVCIGLAVLVVPLCLWGPLPGVSSIDQRIALAALALGVLIALFGGLSEAIFRATGRYPIAAFLGGVVRIGEWGGWLLGLWLVGTFAGVALCGLAIRLGGTLVGILWAGSASQGIVWSLRDARRAEVRAMLKPSISFMAFPLANALSLQGITLLVGDLFGPALVAIFNAYRTLARVAVQLTSMFSLALWPEFSRLFGSGAVAAVRPLYRRAELLGALAAIGLSLAIYWVGPWMLRIWTHGVIRFEPGLMGLLLAYAAAGGLWHVPRTLLMATNQHIDLAAWTLTAGVAVLAAASLMGQALGLRGIGLAMLITEAALAAMCVRLVHQTLRDEASVARCGTTG
jgi:O-antigen/teichoic acid export membrane protein